MSKVNQQDIDKLIELVGGRGNIATVSHCITRLRFVLNDPAIARPKEIEQLRMVKGCFTNAGQFQVVIGTEVGDYYKALLATTGQTSADKEQVKQAARQNMKWHEQLISHFAEIFFPLLPALISGGLILGFRNVIGDLPMSNGQTLAQMHPSLKTIYDFLWLIGEAIFFYLPVGICWSAVKKMGGTPILGIVLGVTLVSPQLMNAYLLGQQVPEVWNFGLFTIAKVGYQAQVIPALLAGLALGFIETRLKRIVPDYLYLVIVPVCSLILAVFLAHAIIGPFGRLIGDGVAFAVRHLLTGSFAPIGAALFGFLYAPLVITGVHQTTLAIDMQMIQSMGGTPVWPLIALSNIAQASAVVGIIIASRKQNERGIGTGGDLRLSRGHRASDVRYQPEIPLPDAVRNDWLWPRRPAVRPERRAGERHRRRRPAGDPLHPAYLLAGVRHGDGYRGGGANYPHQRGVSAQVPSGHLADCLTSSFGAPLAPLVAAGKYYESSPPLVAKRRYLSNLSEEFSGYHRQRYRRPARRHLPPRLSAKAWGRRHLADAVLRLTAGR